MKFGKIIRSRLIAAANYVSFHSIWDTGKNLTLAPWSALLVIMEIGCHGLMWLKTNKYSKVKGTYAFVSKLELALLLVCGIANEALSICKLQFLGLGELLKPLT